MTGPAGDDQAAAERAAAGQASADRAAAERAGLDRVLARSGGSVVTVGMFDGVHRGHQALLGRVVGEARARGLAAGAITFDRHPLEVLRPDSVPPLLCTRERRLALLAGQGLDFVLVLEFTPGFSRRSAEEFATSVLFGTARARAVLVGANFRFGHKAAGDVALLDALARPRGIDVVAVELLRDDGEPVSASRIRQELAAGRVERAARLLGRPFAVEGPVVHGDGRGRAIGVATANVGVPPRLQRPAVGIYAGHVRVDDGPWLPAVTSVGTNPTFGGTELRVETHLLDVDADLYGRHLEVAFEHRLRGEETYASADELMAQIRDDIRQTRTLLDAPSRRR